MNNDTQKGGFEKNKPVPGQGVRKDASVLRRDKSDLGKSASGRQNMKTKHEAQPEIADDADLDDTDDTLKQ